MRRFLFIPVIILIAACNSNSNSNRSTQSVVDLNTLKAKADSVSIPKASTVSTDIKEADKLIGIWGKSEAENASFEISKTTFYYPEHDTYYKYQIEGDSVKITYDDYEESFAFKFKGNDTLVLNGLYGEQVYKRRK